MLVQQIHKNFPFLFKNQERVILQTDRRSGQFTLAKLLNVTTSEVEFAKFWFDGQDACFCFTSQRD
jgi:antitoxin component of MazEF toxin-antitoxin module